MEQNQIHDPDITKTVLDLKKIIDGLRETKPAIAVELKEISEQLTRKKDITMTDIKTITSPKKTKQLTEEVQRMKVMNEELIAKLGTISNNIILKTNFGQKHFRGHP